MNLQKCVCCIVIKTISLYIFGVTKKTPFVSVYMNIIKFSIAMSIHQLKGISLT